MPSIVGAPLSAARNVLFEALRSRIAGEDGAELATRIWADPGPRWFARDSAISLVHQDASMFVGGLRALLVQSLHPLAMAGVAGHSGYRGDPWGRLQRTSAFLAMTTFGPIPEAEALLKKIRRIHSKVRGTAADGRPYSASDPHLLRWIHLTEVDSFLDAFGRFGAVPLTPAMRDEYVSQSGLVSGKLGVIDPPTTYAEVQTQLRAYRPELQSTPEAKDTARFLLLNPPLPLVARPGYALLTTAAVSSLPRWARRYLAIPRIPVAEGVVGQGMGRVGTSVIRWAMSTPRPTAA